jgi:hypothetical protein
LSLPRYRQQVEPGLTPVTQAQPAADAGVGLATAGRALVQAGQLTGSIGLQEYERGINSDNARAMAGFGQEAGDTFARFKALRGEQAVQGAELARLALENARKRWGESLSTDAAKGLFERQSTELAGRYGLGVTSHSLDQLREAEEASAGAAHVSAVNQAALHYNDPTMLDTLATQAGAQAYQLRASDEDGRAKVYAIRQDVLASAISGALKATEQDPTALDHAKALFYGNREALGAKGPGIEAALNAAGSKRQAVATADAIVAQAVDPKTGHVDDALIGAKLLEIKDPNARELARHFVQENTRDAVAAWGQRVDGLFNGLRSQLLEQQSRRGWDPAAVEALKGADRAKYNALVDEANGLARYWRGQKDNTPPSDAQMLAMTRFEVLAAEKDPAIAALSASDFQAMAQALAPRDRERARALYVAAKGGAATTARKPGVVDPGDKTFIKQTAESAFGAKAKDWTTEQSQAFYRASQAIEDWIKANPEAKPQDVEAQTSRWFLRGTIPGSGWISDDTTTRAQAEVSGTGFQPTWSDAQKKQAVQALQAGGLPADDAMVQNYLRRTAGLSSAPVAPETPQEPEAAQPAPPAATPDVSRDSYRLPSGEVDPLYYSAERVAAREAAAATAGKRDAAAQAAAVTPRSRKAALAKLDAMGITDEAAREKQLREWGY